MTPTVVIAENEYAKKAHQELFHWADEYYRLEPHPFKFIESIDGKFEKLHIVGSWQYILKLALFSEELNPSATMFLFKKLGMPEEELKPFSSAPVDDIFYTIYYGKRFEILRKLCHHIRQLLQQQYKGLIVDCHLVIPDRAQIVASSL